MRFATSIFIAAALHAVLFGAAAAVLSRAPAPRPPAPVAVDVEVVAARPDPIDDGAPAAQVARPELRPEPLRRPTRRQPASRPEPAIAGAPRIEPAAMAPAPAGVPDEPAVPAGRAAPAVALQATARGGGVAASAPTRATVSATPRYRSNPPPEYPPPCRRRGEEGIVYLNVVVQPDGLPATVSLERTSGHPLLDRAALEAVRRWIFEPARAAGVPVSSVVEIPVRFSLSDQP